MLDRLKLCIFNRHAPVRRDAAWDGRHFASVCRHCDKPIRRVKRGHWVALQPSDVLDDSSPPA